MIANKKIILALLFSCLFLSVSATTYFVSSSGNDLSNGLSEATPWKSISKVNSAFSTFKPGDKVLFKRGDVFTGVLTPNASGTSGLPIYIGAYGTGANPTISGFTTISGWTNYGNGIYSKSVSCPFDPRMVTLNGVNQPIGRWPESGYYNIDSHSGSSQITANELNGLNWTGGNVVFKLHMSLLLTKPISGHSGSTITFSGVNEEIQNNYGFFINNHLGTLNTLGEWSYDGSTLYMYFGTANPNNHTVKIATTSDLFNANGKNYITVDGITFEGGNRGIYNYNASYLTIQNCIIRFMGNRGIDCFGQGGGGGSYNTVNNCIISDCNNMGINMDFWREFPHATVTNNTVTNIGTIPGMGGNDYPAYSGIRSWSDDGLIQYNTVTNTGYHGIEFSGDRTKILNNFVDTFVFVKGDGGGIYTVIQGDPERIGQEIRNNIVLNAIGSPEGQSWAGRGAEGIYLDDASQNVIIDGNTVAYCRSTGIFLHNAHEVNVTNNTLFANGTGYPESSSAIFFAHENGNFPEDHIRNIVLTGNKFISTAAGDSQTHGGWCITLDTPHDDINLFFTSLDYNYYSRPLDHTGRIAKIWPTGGTAEYKTFAELKTETGKDINSINSSIAVNDVNKIRFEYNASKTNKIVSLDAGYIDITGTKYSGSITLLPYTSVVLMLDPNPSAAPSIPSYVSSAIENSTPAILEMTYSLTLANVAPTASAFSVKVNSAARVVNTVAISGTKVRLSLATPILYGDVVTVAYSKPSINPLQTSAGGQATNLSAQTATNRVNSSIIPVGPVYPVYVSSAIENETPTKIEIVYSIPLSNVLPAVSSFTVNINSISRPVSSVAILGSSVILTLLSPVIFGDVITVSYTKPATNALQSTTGLQVATMSAQQVSNKISSVGPIYVSASVEKVTPNILEILYNENLDNSIPTTSAFVVMVNGIQGTITSIAISGKKVLLTLANPVVYGDIITVSYIKPATNPLKKSTGEAAGSFSSPQRVTNNIIKKSNIYVYPNPAREYINISIKEPSREKQIIRIFDFSGKLCLETILDPLANTIHIPISLNSGVYIVQVILGSLTSFTQKIIITN